MHNNAHPDSRRSTKRALLRIRADSRERIRNHRNEQIDEPEIEHDETNDEEKARHEELGIDHLVHDRGPLQSNHWSDAMMTMNTVEH